MPRTAEFLYDASHEITVERIKVLTITTTSLQTYKGAYCYL